VKSFPGHKAHIGRRADLRFLSPQPDTSLHCEASVCLFD